MIRSRRPAALASLAVVGLIAVVAAASGGASVWAPARGGAADRVVVLLTVAVVWGLGIAMVGAVGLALHRATAARRAGARVPLRTALLRALPATTVALVLASLLAISGLDPGRSAPDDGPVPQAEWPGQDAPPLSVVGWWKTAVMAAEGEPESEGSGGADGGPGAVTRLLAGILLVAACVAGAAAWYGTRSRRRRPDGTSEADADAAHGAVIGTIDAMLADPDPSTAIIGAYARLLEGLAACGAPRREHEAPLEHLHRVLTILQVRPGPLRRLVELFEVARFSTHPLTAAHRRRALDALRDVAADLAPGSPSFSVAGGGRPVGPRP